VRRKLCLLVPTHWEAIMGGSQYQAKVLVDYLLRHYDVDIVYLTRRARPEFTPQGYRIVCFSDRRGLRRYGSFFDVLRLYRALRAERPDIILQFVGSAYTGIAALYAKLHGCAMLWRVTSDRSVEPERAPWWQAHRWIERGCLELGIRHSTLVLAQTDYQRRQLARRRGARVRLLPNFHPSPPDRGPAGSNVHRIVWIANLKPLKNPAAFVRLARRFSQRLDVRFVMAGAAMGDDAWTREQLASIAATPNLDYLGAQTQDEVNSLLEGAALLVNTSDYEGFSNTFIQAWMRRVPVASLHVDPDGLLAERGLGVLAGSEDALYERVAVLLDSAEERSAIGARARAYALANHAEGNIEWLAQLLQLNSSGPQPRSSSSSSRSLISSRASSASS
jgi:glycosyltransferase involved in cell wall biosynthesis